MKQNQRPGHKPGQRGQASLMVAMMITTFILFFAFVVNTGMLVNARINLQNAADLAAYSGAAQQARLLNSVSYLNYEMRRQYKKFLFRYYVLGNMAQDSFPRSSGGGNGSKTPAKWTPGTGGTSYGVPAVCMIFNNSDNFCHLSNLPKITIPPASPLDAINTTLRGELGKIEALRQKNCASISATNLRLLLLWLFNADPDLKNLEAQMGSSPDDQQIVRILRGLASGLGLVPRELILHSRIKTLATYLNAPAAKGVDRSKIDDLRGASDPTANERTIDAFLSAFNTLGDHTFAEDTIVMDELLPGTAQTGQNVLLQPINVAFDTYAVQFQLPNAASPDPTDCPAGLEVVTIPSPGVPLGVYKDPSVLTYYAIRLKATAKVLFSPFGDMELKAYAAARPFGSRVGPRVLKEEVEGMFLRQAIGNVLEPQQNPIGFVPNLPVDATDNTQSGGWNAQETLGAYYQAFAPQAPGQSQNVKLGPNDFLAGMQLAGAPNPYEGNRYNIPNDSVNDPFIHNFDSNCQAKIWAPILPPGQAGGISQGIAQEVDNLFNNNGTQPPQDPTLAQFQAALKQAVTTYVSSLASGTLGEDNEGFKVAPTRDPFKTRADDVSGACKPLALPGGVMVTDPNLYRTSWKGVRDGDYQALGRVGYSVKFVSFESLTSKKQASNGVDPWTNDGFTDPEADQDVSYLRH